MKKLLIMIITFAISLGIGVQPYAQAQEQSREIPVLVDGLPVTFDVQPVNQDNRIMIPFRAIAEALNINVTWDSAAKTISASDGKSSIRLQIGSKTAYRNEAPVPLAAPPVIKSGKTLIPLRFFSEAFGCSVEWDKAINGVRISSPPGAMAVIGFYALGDSKTSSWEDLFGKAYPETDTGNTNVVSDLALGWYSLDEQGNLLTRSTTGWQRPDGWEKVLEAAGQYNLKTGMVVHLTDKDATISRLITDETAMNKAVSGILEEAKRFNGVNLDFEGLGWKDTDDRLTAVRDGFTRFVSLLSGRLKEAGLRLTLTLHALNSAYKGYDYPSLGKLADRIIIMAYDYGSSPEPVSLVTKAVEMAKDAIPPEKLILGISSPSETPESIPTKVGMAKRYKLGGIALWRLGLVSDGMWNVLKQLFK